MAKKNRTHYEKRRLITYIIILVLATAAVGAGMFVKQETDKFYYRMDEARYPVVLRQMPSSSFDVYYSDFGPYREENDKNRELFSYARYLHNTLLSHAYDAMGDSDTAALKKAVADENLKYVSGDTLAQMRAHGDFR